MSHFAVLVVTSKEPNEENIVKALQPFHEFECTGIDDEFVKDVDITEEAVKDGLEYHGLEEMSVDDESKVDKTGPHKYGYAVVNGGVIVKATRRTNPNKKWDWWMVGGRYRNMILLKNGERGDCAMKSDIDFNGMKNLAEVKAAVDWEKVHAIIGPFIEGFEKWVKVRYEMLPGQLDKAWEFYNEQPLIVATKGRAAELGYLFQAEEYLFSKDEYVKRAGEKSFLTFAFLRNGEWIEKGEMGWWACVSNEKTDWPEQFKKLIEDIPENNFLTVVDCHI